MKYLDTNIKVISCKLFIIIVSCYIYLYTGEILLCDDGLIPTINDYNEAGTNGITSCNWEMDYRGKNIIHEYPTHYNDGTPIYKSYNVGSQETSYGYYTHYNDGTPIYKPYNEGLQETLHGYRYELNSNSIPVNTRQEPSLYELDGSSQIGEISPTRSEVINNGYYYGSGYKMPLDTSKTTTKRRLYNKVKMSIKNHIAKSSDEALRQDRIRSEMAARRYQEYKEMKRVQTSRKILSRINPEPTPFFSNKVRRFD